MSKPRRPELRFLISLECSNDSKVVRFTADLVTLNDEGKVRNIRADWAGDPLYGLADLQVTAQADLDRETDFYAAKVEYRNVFSVSLKDAEGMVKTLRKVNRVFEAEDVSMDWSYGLADHLRLASKALGVGGYIIAAGKASFDWGHDGVDYRPLSLEDVVNLADGYVAGNREGVLR